MAAVREHALWEGGGAGRGHGEIVGILIGTWVTYAGVAERSGILSEPGLCTREKSPWLVGYRVPPVPKVWRVGLWV